ASDAARVEVVVERNSLDTNGATGFASVIRPKGCGADIADRMEEKVTLTRGAGERQRLGHDVPAPRSPKIPDQHLVHTGMRLEAVNPATRAGLSARQHRVLPDVGAGIDHGHVARQPLLQEGERLPFPAPLAKDLLADHVARIDLDGHAVPESGGTPVPGESSGISFLTALSRG